MTTTDGETDTHPEGDIETAERERVARAMMRHVPFDGWTDRALAAALADEGLPGADGRRLFPRGAVDLALANHARGDSAMLARIEAADMEAMRFRDRIAAAVRFRIEAAGDRETVRRGVTLFALPQYSGDGARAVWGTVDAIWTALGDRSDDVNWYTKRATLSAVYCSTLLYWLGDDGPDHRATWAFLDRRIDDVMQIETLKARIRDNPADALTVGDLAGAAGMSASSFHEHFKAVTGTTPLQYQKDLRLLEAQRLLLDAGRTVSAIAYDVGYESPNQFSREYRRKFGVPPRDDRGRVPVEAV